MSLDVNSRTMDELKKFRRDRPSDDPGHLEGAVEETETYTKWQIKVV